MFCRAGIQYFLIYSNVVWTLLTLTLTGSQKGVTRWKVKKRRGGSHRPRGFSSHGVRCEHVWISSPVTLDSCCFCEVLFSMLNTVTLFCMCLCFCKNHIYFTIFVDKKKNYLILIVFFYLNAIIIQFISPPPPHPPPSSANYVQKFCSKTKNHVISKHIKGFWYTVELILIFIHISLEGRNHEGFTIFLEDTWDSPLSHRGRSCLSS